MNEIKLYEIVYYLLFRQGDFEKRMCNTPPGWNIAYYCARLIMSHEANRMNQIKYKIGSISVAIWISKNWNLEQLITYILEKSCFGNGFNGIDAASNGYFMTRQS